MVFKDQSQAIHPRQIFLAAEVLLSKHDFSLNSKVLISRPALVVKEERRDIFLRKEEFAVSYRHREEGVGGTRPPRTGGQERMRRGSRTRPSEQRAKRATACQPRRGNVLDETESPKRGKGAARNREISGGTSHRDLGIPNPHLIRESLFSAWFVMILGNLEDDFGDL